MRVATTEQVTMNNHKPPTHLDFCLLRCCAAKVTSSHSLTCICDRERRSPKLLSSAILHWEMMNKIFWETIFATACSLLQSLHHGSSTSLSDARQVSSPSTRTPSSRASLPDHRCQGTASRIRFLLSNHVLHIEYVDLRSHNFSRISVLMFAIHCCNRSIYNL
jgi:hypothetical protein